MDTSSGIGLSQRTRIGDFPGYVQRYGEELESVVHTYIERLRQGTLLSIIHLNELVLYLLTGRIRGHSACAVELSENYDIVGGRLTACADLPLSLGVLPAVAGERDESPDLSFLVSYRQSPRLSRMWCVPVLRRPMPGAGAGRFA